MRLRLVAPTLAATVALVPLAACSSSSGQSADTTDPCSGLDLSLSSQATVKAYAEAASSLRSHLADIENRVYAVCDAMNLALALTRPRNTYDACDTFGARVTQAQAAGADISLQLDASCTVDSASGASCAEICPAASCSPTDCPDSVPCNSACTAVAAAGVACTTTTVPMLTNVDAALQSAITANADEWGTLQSLVSQIEPTVTQIGPPILAYAQVANIITKDEQDCYQNALGNLGVALISFDASRDGLAWLPSTPAAPTN